MADEKIVTSIVANSDFSNLIADVQRVTGSLFKLQQEFAGANRALAGQISATNAMFKESMLKTGQFSSHFVSLTSDVEKFGRNLDSGRLKLKDYFRVYQENVRTSGGLIRDLAKQQVQLQNAVLQPLGKNAQGLMQYNVHIPRGLDLTKNKTALLKQELQIMNKVIQDGGVQLINWGKNTQWAGRQLTVGLTLPLAAFGKAAADAFKVADQELTRLTKVYGDVAGTSSQELVKIRKEVAATAKELSQAMGVNFSETIGLAADIAATGKTGNELLASVSETTRLAVLGEVDRQEAMKATLAIQSAFKQNTEELSKSINFLNAVENQTSTTLNDLVEAIPKAGPVIQGLGGSVQDLALYLTAMREGGINASEGANALKSALASLINPTDVAVSKFKSFGIDLLGIVKNNAGDVTGTLMALQSALDRLDPLSKQQAIEQLFGKFQFSRLNALFENLGREGSQTLKVLDLMKASTSELGAVADRELAAVTESASGRYRRAIEGLRAELAGVGDQFLDIGTKLVNALSKVIDFASKLPDPIKKLLAFGGAFTAIIGPVIMLTGVLANFFGYIVKGLGHFKALFKGAEGFKLLTPEIMAAKAASEQMGNEFYSDARAADTLRLAIEKLNEDLIGLQVNARKATQESSKLGVTMSTAGGTPLILAGGGQRIVNPEHPLLGSESRAAAHLNPRDPKNPTTLFGLTMQPIPVNRKIGASPQILMNDRLPDVPGLTTVKGVSTGIVASEHARYAALMAALGVQSRQEIEELKKTIGLGGQVSKEFIDTFDDILPITQRLTQNAAVQSAQIVAELKAGKLNVEQAKAAIISVNAELERTMGIQVTQYAASRGRTIDLTKAPLIDQPVVDASGKPNTRGMFRQGIFGDVMRSVGRATRTRTFGGPYSIETTRPQRFNAGGQVYTSPNIVPGPNVNADIVPAVLTPGEFVVNRKATQANLPLLMAINDGAGAGPRFFKGGRPSGLTGTADFFLSGLLGLAERSRDKDFPRTQRMRHIIHDAAGIMNIAKDSGVDIDPAEAVRMSVDLRKNIDDEMIGKPDTLLASVTNKHLMKLEKDLSNGYGVNLKWKAKTRPGGPELPFYRKAVEAIRADKNISPEDRQLAGLIYKASRRKSNRFVSEHARPFREMTENEGYIPKRNIGHAIAGSVSINQVTNRLAKLLGVPDVTFRNQKDQIDFVDDIAKRMGYRDSENLLAKESSMRSGFRSQLLNQLLFSAASRGKMRRSANSGGLIPGYFNGGRAKGLPKSIIEKITKNWGAVYGGDSLSNQDPLHGPLGIGKFQPPRPTRMGRKGASVEYRRPGATSNVEAFLTGSLEQRGKYVTAEYMLGNYDVLRIPGAVEAMKAWGKKATGKFYRGINLTGTRLGPKPLPDWLLDDIKKAKATGDFSNLIGKEFIMRRSSWSSNPDIAKEFGDFNIVADVQNRRVTPASEMLPGIRFAPKNAKTKQDKIKRARTEEESIFGGKFRIVAADEKGLQLETVADQLGGRRRFGGSVFGGMSYVVGENGPEIFTPGTSGKVVPGFKAGGIVNRGRSLYGDNIDYSRTPFGLMQSGAIPYPTNRPAPARQPNPFGLAANIKGTIATMAGYSAGQMIGGRFGQTAGYIGGTIGSILAPSLLMGWGKSAGEAAAKGNMLQRTFGLLRTGITRINPAIAIGTVALAGLYAAFKKLGDSERLNAKSFGLTAEAAQKAGIKYTDYNQKIKDSVASVKLLLDKNKLIYESMASAGTPFNITIEQYKKLRKEVKSTMQEQIDIVNNASNKDVNQLAVRLKEQFVAAGMSAEEASKKIYALFTLSNKSKFASSALSTAQFAGITDQQSAAISAVGTFNLAKQFNNSKEQAMQLNTALTAIDAGIENIMKTSEKAAEKDKTGKTKKIELYQAEKEQLDLINNNVKNQEQIGQDVLNQLAKQNPEIKKFATATDTIVSLWQKLRIQAAGFTGDLTRLNSTQVDQLYTLTTSISQAVEETNRKRLLKKQYDNLTNLTNKQKDLEKAAKGQSVQEQINARDAIRAIDKKIKKINEEADARKKALQEEAQATDMALRIKQQGLEYERAVATGDFTGAASAQLELRKLQNEQQRTLAEQQIEERRLKDLAPLEAEKERLQKAQELLADKAALAGETLDSLNKRIETQKGKIDAVNSAMSALQLALIANKDNLEKYKQSDEFKNLAAAFLSAAKGAGVATGPEYTTGFRGQKIPIRPEDQAMALFNNYSDALSDSLATKGITTNGPIIINGKELDTGTTGKYKSGTKNNPVQISGEYKTGKDGALTDEARQEIVDLFGLSRNQYFEYKGKSYRTTGVKLDKSGPITVSPAILQKASGGLLRGPGTGTSDSIIGMYSNGGMVRVSNGEYIVNADTVSRLGVPFFDRINNMKNGGLMLNYNMPKYDNGGELIGMGAFSAASGGSVYNVGNVTMQFAEAPANGKQLFEEFKAAMALEQRKSGIDINMSRRYS